MGSRVDLPDWKQIVVLHVNVPGPLGELNQMHSDAHIPHHAAIGRRKSGKNCALVDVAYSQVLIIADRSGGAVCVARYIQCSRNRFAAVPAELSSKYVGEGELRRTCVFRSRLQRTRRQRSPSVCLLLPCRVVAYDIVGSSKEQ